MDAFSLFTFGAGIVLTFIATWTGRARNAMIALGIVLMLIAIGKWIYQTRGPGAPANFSNSFILKAIDPVSPRWDHKAVIVEVYIKNDGTQSSKLDLWSVSAQANDNRQTIAGLITQPPPGKGEEFVLKRRMGNAIGTARIRYDLKSYLPLRGDYGVRGGDHITGLLLVMFPAPVDMSTLIVGFYDDAGNPYTVFLKGGGTI